MATQITEPIPSKHLIIRSVLLGIGLGSIGACSRMIGEFARDAAVLLLIFVPLDMWKPQLGTPFSGHWGLLLSIVSLVLGFGMALELLAMAAFRLKRNLEGTDDGTE